MRLSGDDTETIFQLVDRVRAHLRSIPGTKSVRDNWGLRTKKLVVRINEPRALRAGVTNEDVAVSLQTDAYSGIETTQFREADRGHPGDPALGGRGSPGPREARDLERLLPGHWTLGPA